MTFDSMFDTYTNAVNREPDAILRFDVADRVEHALLILSFTTLAVTGLAQKFADNYAVTLFMTLFGGIDAARAIHRTTAMFFLFESVYHVFMLAYKVTVRRTGMTMMPGVQDVRDFIQMLGYFLGRGDYPHFGRYSYEEKIEYWALVWGSVVMALTGLVMWFPSIVTQVITGEIVPIARAAHSGEAVLAVLSIATWHVYHTSVKTRNSSIFTGRMSVAHMREEHAREYERLVAARARRAAPQPKPEVIAPPALPPEMPVLEVASGNGHEPPALPTETQATIPIADVLQDNQHEPPIAVGESVLPSNDADGNGDGKGGGSECFAA